MARDDQRMHGGNTPGLVPGRGHERHEDPVTEADRIGAGEDADRRGTNDDLPSKAGEDVTGGAPASALGGEVATRSGTQETPDDERTG